MLQFLNKPYPFNDDFKQYPNQIIFIGNLSIRNWIKIKKEGICNEKDWPYDISKFTEEPPKELYEKAKHHLAIKYERVEQGVNHMKECLNQGLPFVFGFTVFEGFESKEVAETGNMKMPKKDEWTPIDRGVRARKHPTRKYGVKFDRYY